MNNMLIKNKQGIRKILIVLVTILVFLSILKTQVNASEDSISYIIEDEYITRILPETTVEDFKIKLETEDIEITSQDGAKLNDTDIISTGTIVKIGENTYNISVIGDINGDGKLTSEDVIKCERHLINVENVSKEYLKSIDINNDGKYTITDLVQMNLIASNEKKIEDYIENSFKEELLFGMPEETYEPDGDEDEDGLTNAEEEQLGTKVYSVDTDEDGLIDYYEVNISKTNPLLADTDGDGINDGDELSLGLDPLKADSKGDGINDGERELTYTVESDDTNVNIEITGKGNIASTTIDVLNSKVKKENTNMLNKIYNFHTSGTIEQAIVTIKYKTEELEKEGLTEENITLYYLNTEKQQLEEIESIVNKENKTITATLNHFSMYIIGKKALEEFELNVDYNEWIDADENGTIDEIVIANSRFNPKENGFSFENFASNKSKGGQCYGMATFAMAYYIDKLPMKSGYNKLWSFQDFSYVSTEGYDLSNTYFEKGSNLYDYEITDEGLKYFFLKDQLKNFRDRIENKVYKINEKYVDIMKKSGITFYEKKISKNENIKAYQKPLLPVDISDNNTTLSNDEKQMLNSIWSLYILQFADECTSFGNNPDQAFDELQSNLQNGVPVVIDIGSHAINAISLIQDLENPNKYKIAVYDNNYPGEIRYIYVTRSKFNKIQLNFTAWTNDYNYKCIYDKGDGEKEITISIRYPKIKEEEKDSIYVKLYDDGTLAFTATDKTLEGKTLVTSYGDIAGKDLDIPWYDDCNSITSVDIADEIKPTSTAYWFYHCSKITEIKNISNLDTSNVTNMRYMFDNCNNLSSLNISNFDTSNVTDMSCMFYYCKNLSNLDLSKFDTSNVTNMGHMFYNCNSLTSLDLSTFDTSKVTDMSYMFASCNNLSSLNVSNFDTSKVTDMVDMFGGCYNLSNLDLSNFDTSNVTDMNCMFCYCENLSSLNVSNFDTSKVTDMSYMFESCKNLSSLDLSNFDTSNVTVMSCMFYYCKNLSSLNISNFDTSSVTSMRNMFGSCENLSSLDLSNFNTSKVTNMSAMFAGCYNLKSLNLSNFDTSKVTDMMMMFLSDEALNVIYVGPNWIISDSAYTLGMFHKCGTNEVTKI